LGGLGLAEIQAADHLFFSHFHMDHVAGFDGFFRINFSRETKPVHVWGPPLTVDLMQHRFRSFWWNLHRGQPGTWIVHEIHGDRVESARMETSEAFEVRHPEEPGPADPVTGNADYRVTARLLDHHGPCAAYRVDESRRVNVRPDRLAASGLRPGAWIQDLKNPDVTGAARIEGREWDWDRLRADLLEVTPGASVAYLTDFRLDEAWTERLADWLRGCGVLVCEAQYAHADEALAAQHAHSTARQVAELARRAEVGRLELFHLSRRYPEFVWREMLREAREIFPRTGFPSAWNL
jgi:ribonuclease Z